MTNDPASAEQSLRRYMAAGYLVVILVVFGIGGWAATAQLSGAVIGQGHVVVASKIKHIRHPTGGVIRSVRVHDGDHVKAGDILIQLDPTQSRATATIIANNVDDLTARKARLEAERDNLDEIRFPSGFRGARDRPRPRYCARGRFRATPVQSPSRRPKRTEGAAQ